MGLLLDRYVKSKDKRFWITTCLDILIIVALIFFAFHIKGEWQNGYNFCAKQSCAVCGVYSHNMNNTSSVFNNISIPLNGS